ncbi:uncharacterized protein PSANT_02005 [Moesziomyces antarcticus]|uniref:Uncharacterized protein n=1 Tax=Pseudozyma antarctica TaxID=84753 RepID=A0A5C3FJF0_PSEA2|nr:uncharacterized protein PSANT_02005 [Moesziomyces antarcticus]
MSAVRPVVGSGLAGCCTVVSTFGAVILAIFGYGFQHNWPALMGSTEDPEDGIAVGQTCYVAALIYIAFIAFCGCQLGVHRRYSRIQL